MTELTHNQGHTLDLVISKGIDLTPKCIPDVCFSDHFCIFFFNVALLAEYVPGLKLVKRRAICAETSGRFIARHTNSVRGSSSQFGFKLSSLSLSDNLVNNSKFSVTRIMDDVAPMKTKIKAPWRNMERLRALKRTCRKSEHKWPKTKLQVDYGIYKDLLSNYNIETKIARQHYFSQIITENVNNSKVLFSTSDKLVNSLRSIPAEFHSSVKCKEFATSFHYKISNIRNKIMASPTFQLHTDSV